MPLNKEIKNLSGFNNDAYIINQHIVPYNVASTNRHMHKSGIGFYENGSSELTNEILEKVNNLRQQQNDYKDLVDWVDTTLYNLEIEE